MESEVRKSTVSFSRRRNPGRNYPAASDGTFPCPRERWECSLRSGGVRRGLDSFIQMALGGERRIAAGRAGCPGVGYRMFLPVRPIISRVFGRILKLQSVFDGAKPR